MRLYSLEDQEALRARKLLKDWTADTILTPAQREQLEGETPSDLRTTNIFLRVVLFFFTLLVVAAAIGLYWEMFLTHPSDHTLGILCLCVAAACYAGAEAFGLRARLFRYGMEEALATCAVGFLCGALTLLFSPHSGLWIPFIAPTVAALLALWVWLRFGLWYSLPAAMIFCVYLPQHFTSLLEAQHALLAGLYLAGLIVIVRIRSTHAASQRVDVLAQTYSLGEAFLWLGIYLALNLWTAELNPLRHWFGYIPEDPLYLARPFYWTTWLLTWCLPAIVLSRGIRIRDRSIITAGGVTALLTIFTNRLYFGWPQHTWDPMLLGLMLMGTALVLRSWLARAIEGIRHGFTATRTSGKDDHWLEAGGSFSGLVSPQSITPSPQASHPVPLGGDGASGGGGATRD